MESLKRRIQRSRARKKWRQNHTEARNELRSRYYKSGALYNHNHRVTWTSAEDMQITDPNRPCDRVLARKLKRTIGAIQVERCRLRRMKKEHMRY